MGIGSEFDFTGERFVPGRSGKKIELDHMERYIFAQQYAKGKKILDIACGSGYAANIFLDSGAKEYTGVDISKHSIQYAKKHYSSDSASFIVGDICNFNTKETFDLIVCFETIEHVECYSKALKNLSSMLSDNGVLLISSPNRKVTSPRALSIQDTPKNPYHTQEFLIDELKEELLSAGFKIKEKSVYGQRQRWLYDNKLFHYFVRLTRFPDFFAYVSSPKIRRVKGLTPRYFIIVAR